MVAGWSSSSRSSTARDPSRLKTTKSREALNLGSWSRRWHVSRAEKSLSPTLLIRSFWTAFSEELSSLRLLTMVAKISFSGSERGSLLVAYLAQYSMTLRRDTQYCMSTLARHADSWTGLKLLTRPSFRAVSRTGSSSSVTRAVSGWRRLG